MKLLVVYSLIAFLMFAEEQVSPATENVPAKSSSSQPTPVPRTNILELINGTLVVSVSSEYSSGWSAFNHTDGSTEKGWCSAQGEALPHAIVFELVQLYALTGIAADNTRVQEDGYAEISSRAITVYGSTSSATGSHFMAGQA